MSARIFERIILPGVVVLVVLQLVAAQMIWTANTTSQESEDQFALFLAISLVSFSVISYLYRVERRGRVANKGLLFLGFLFITTLLVTALIVGQSWTSTTLLSARISATEVITLFFGVLIVGFVVGRFTIGAMTNSGKSEAMIGESSGM